VTPEEAFQKAVERHRRGDLAEAIALYDRLLEVFPTHADTLHLRGMTELQRGNLVAGAAFLDRALAADPNHAEAKRVRVQVAGDQLIMQADAFLKAKLFIPALEASEKAVGVSPGSFDAHFVRASVLRATGHFQEALESCETALGLAPESVRALALRGLIFKDIKQPERALADLECVLETDPDMDLIAGEAMMLALQTCEWDGFAKRTENLLAGVAAGKSVVQPYVMTFVPSSPAQQKRAAEIYFAMNNPVISQRPAALTSERMRIGYFSSDLHEHPTGQLLVDLLAVHDRAQFEIIAFSFGGDPNSPTRERIRRACDQFIDVLDMTDGDIAKLSREKYVSIAVDLNGYTALSRPGIFAAGAAPLHVNYLGYPGTLGTDVYDYIVGDRFVTPPEHFAHFSERVVTMPHSYQPNTAATRTGVKPLSRAEAGLPADGFVFCCFNSFAKITPDVFDVWMRLLREVDGSLLWLLDGAATAKRNLRDEAKARGVAPDRLVFAPRAPLGTYLARYPQADLFLDTFHYNAHTTGSDSLLMGVPVLTRLGDAFPARVGASLLSAVGLPELIAQTTEDYGRIALELARDPAKLAGLRSRLAQDTATLPLFDTERYTRALESAYRAMWDRCAQGLAPDHITVR
jgi:predicted O-linked N-acetylglucosamine transferase (SPINDLY family)